MATATQPELCGCGTRHRSETAAAKCPERPQPLVDADDVLGVLGLVDGRLIRTATGVMAVSPFQGGCPPLPGQVKTQREVFAVMATLAPDGEALRQRLNRTLRTGLPIAAAVSTELAERTAAALSAQLKSVA